MRKAVILFAVSATMMIPAAALATPPEVVDEGEFDLSYLDPDMSEVCGFEVNVAVVGAYKVTVFYDKNGEPVRERIHEGGKALWTSANGEAWENYTVNVDIDLATGEETFKGNVWNLHAGAGGILVNDSGRIVFGGSEVIVNGPHQAWDGDFAGLCEALS